MNGLPDRLKLALAERYLIERELGSGGMATVYLAEDLKHRRRVALKVLKPELAHAVGADRFLREIRITAQLNHPHILPLLDSGETDGFLYFVVPYVTGESLRARMDREGPLPVDEALRIAEQVASALEHAHRQEVIHRDIKPENILLYEGEAMVADFGIAVAVSAAGGERLTETGIAVGTPAFMSPEQASGDEAIDERSDIYSLGCVLYEMLGGEAPHVGETPRAIMAQKLVGDARSIRELRPEADAALEAVLARALEAAPEDRFATAGEFGKALQSPEVGWTIAAKRLRARRRKVVAATAAGLAVLVLAVGAVLQYVGSRAEPKMLVVLPLENLGAPEDEHYADGIADEVRVKLGAVSGLRVVARWSSVQYKDSDKTLGEIGEELGVDYLLGGTIRWDRTGRGEGRVSIVPELVRVADATALWTSRYDTAYSGVLDLPANIAERVAEALGISLPGAEREAVRVRPTDNLEAYEFYLQGNVYFVGDRTLPVLEAAQQMYERAVEIDPQFALAYARLSENHSNIYQWGLDRTAERLRQAEDAVNRAFEIRPNLPEAHVALAQYYYVGFRDYERALAALEVAGEALPGNVYVLAYKAAIAKRQGRFEEAISFYREVRRLDPRLAAHADMARNLAYLHRYAEAAAYYDTALVLAPDQLHRNLNIAWLRLYEKGETDSLRSALEYLLARNYESRSVTYDRWYVEFFDRDHSAALEVLARSEQGAFELQNQYWPTPLLAGFVHLAAGDPERAQASFDSARRVLEVEVQEHPEDYRRLLSLGLAYAGLGRKDEAIRAGLSALELPHPKTDLLVRGLTVGALVRIYAMLGEQDAAIDQLESYLALPRRWSVQAALRDPRFDPLRDHPRFQALLDSHDQPTSL
ncbi:MAG: protein kinase [Gemmatimonadota bacterium]|nr:MAG: protein kinase [Gemmatimonadota bacterium]